MEKIKILWADDEIDLLKPQIMFLEKRGYDVLTVSNGYDALEECENTNDIDVVFLDESMPGITGLETLTKIKTANPTLPVVMITKNEAENVMEEAIGSQISDYLIKPVNPNQILLTLKKIIDNKRLVREKTQADELGDILSMQKTEANAGFSKFVEKKYESWVTNKEEDAGPIMSHDLLRKKVFPIVEDGVPTVMLLLDNLRFDQWKVIEPIISELYRVEEEDFFYSSLPTTTQYSRNAIFAGMTPGDISKRYPNWWFNDNEKGGKNMHEKDLLGEQINRTFRKEIKWDYFKVTTVSKALGLFILQFGLLYKKLQNGISI